ncbi:MAG: cadmium-translocating P-type ATPase [Oscillospiraceae bacterium]|nr:cadmium-translocating P-type ATPase [Oscillospiraceae bacterium]
MSEEELRTETSGKEECGGHCRGHSHASHACTECGSCDGCHEEEAGFLLPRVCISAALFIAALFIGPPWLKTVFFAAAALISGYDVLIGAVRGVISGHAFDEHLLMTVACIGAFAIGESAEGAAVMILYQLGEYLQDRAVDSSRGSIRKLMDLRPDTVTVLEDGEQKTVAAETVAPGDLFVVAPGGRIALDGTVEDGVSELDTSALTGEPLPRYVEPGMEVCAGCVNLSGTLRIRATAGLADSSVSRILELVEKAEEKKSPTERFITRFASRYTPAVIAAAVIIAVIVPLVTGQPFAKWLHRALVFLVISCPCALVISIPLTFFAGIGGAAKRGILFKGADSLYSMARTDTVMFDKTGTLTHGRFSVTEVKPVGTDREGLLMAAACAEAFSSHPIARSIIEEYGKNVDVSRITKNREIRGKGTAIEIGGVAVTAGNAALMDTLGVSYEKEETSGTVVYVTIGLKYAGCIILEDTPKPDAGSAVQELRDLGVGRIAMCTGDRKEPSEEVAAGLGIDDVYSECLPEDKFRRLEELRADRKGDGTLVFVGDGINDAPVLAAADVGVAMGGLGSDAAIEAADVVLMTDEPSKVAEAVGFAGETRKIARQNVIFALAVKAVIMILGIAGIANMWIAVFADVGVALLCILNAMRAYSGGRASAPAGTFAQRLFALASVQKEPAAVPDDED